MSRACTSDPRGLLANKRALIVDDDMDSRELMRVVLESCDMEVTDAESAPDALAALERSDFDVLISDIGMPAIDGYSLIRGVRALPKSASIPAVAVTAFRRMEDRAQALLAGFNLHIGKPVDIPAFIQALVALLARAGRCA
jgi:CheY-like chemotaxis protein